MKKYSYKLRPAYNSNELLIELERTGDTTDFLKDLLQLLSKNGFSFDTAEDIWMNDEIWIQLDSSNGNLTVIRDIWDLVFIMGNKNQADILKINQILLNSGDYEKIEVDPSDYISK